MPNPIATQDSASPFDAIRDQDGTWSARKLMVLMGYTTWRNFTVPLGRAMKSAEVQGHDVGSNFAGSRKVSASGPDADDYALSRFAAYLVAMNGDPNKLEVAQAQAYFATKTREAESNVMPALPQDYASALRALADETEEKAVLAAKVEADAPKVTYVDTYVADDDDRKIRDVAKSLGIKESDLRDALIERKWIYQEHTTRWSDSKQKIVPRYRYSAYADKTRYFDPRPDHGAPRFKGEVMHTLKVTPEGAAAIARQARIWGLVPRNLVAVS